ncbi:MAG: hypothetical protein J6J27_02255 [Alphaproteobacteria bacterium]|nr:hypothetical protein [Alphaproteobacteria bacterium]
MKPEEYLARTCHSLKNPRLEETPAIHRQFQTLADYILGGDFNEPIFVFDCYTTEVYPRYIQLSDCNFMAWDNHFWDIYGRFLFMYFTYINVGSLMPQEFFINYYKSMLLIFLANRCEKYPAFSRYLAEEYSKMDMKFPPYDEHEDINDILDKVGHQQEFNISRMFGFCHEISHVAFRKKNAFSQTVQEQVVIYCESVVKIIELSREVDTLLGRKSDEEQNERMLDITKKLLANSDKKLLEEICCDIMALFVLYKYFEEECGMEQEQIGVCLSTVHYFLVCTSWLSSSEDFWNGLREVYTNIENDNAFVDPDNPFYNLGDKITDEYAVRTSFVFSFCKDKMDIKLDDSWVHEELNSSGFIAMLEQARGIDVMDRVLNRTKNAKTDYTHAIAHQKKKNQLIGWENK